MNKKKKHLSLFSACGGLDLGFMGGFPAMKSSINYNKNSNWIANEIDDNWWMLEENDFEICFANDIKKSAKAAWVNYFSKYGIDSSIYHVGSIIDFVKNTQNGDNIFPSDIDIITGGFPCQDFSLAGKRRGFNSHKSHTGNPLEEYEDPKVENRGKLYMWMREVIDIIRPKVFIAENVKGLISIENVKDVIENDFRTIGEEGYIVVSSKILHAGEFGVPQTRERIIFFGFDKTQLSENAKNALSSSPIPKQFNPYPSKTHTLAEMSTHYDTEGLRKIVTVREALEGLTEPNISTDLSQQSYSKAKYYGKHVQGQIEVKLDKLGPTIRAEHHGNIEFRRLSKKHGGKHNENKHKERRLTVRECARLQTFPDDYEFVKSDFQEDSEVKSISASEAYKLIGDAVPPILAYNIARRLQSIWPLLFQEEKI